MIAVDVASTDRSAAMLSASTASLVAAAPTGSSFGGAVAHAVGVAPPASDDDEWLWLLGHDNAPQPDALARLLAAVEIAPSVAVAGPKLMQWDAPDVIAEYGESMTPSGASLVLVGDELDQAQHDVQADVLGVAAGGMIVRRAVWDHLNGFDPGLPTVDASLDFSVRARLAGHRVVVVPDARVSSSGGPEFFGAPHLSDASRARWVRAAQLHRRLVYAPAWAVPLHWLSLLPVALLRSIVHLLAKRPSSVPGEISAAASTAIDLGGVRRARRTLAATKAVGWGAIAPLRVSWRQAREQRVHRIIRHPSSVAGADHIDRIGFVSGGGLWTLLATALIGVIAYGTLLGADTLVGGGLLPLSADVGTLWSNVGWGHRDLGVGFTGAADPFAWVLAVLGTLSPGNPSAAIVGLYFVALPLASVGAWFCARRFTSTRYLPSVAAVLWAVAPPLLGALDSGRLGAVIAHVLLPWVVLLVVMATRSWSAAAGASVVAAAVAASAPPLIPALVVLLVVWTVSHARSAHRLLLIVVPAAVLFAPLVIDQVERGRLVGVLADPGVPLAGSTMSGVQLGLGSAAGGSDGWSSLLASIALPGVAGPFVAAVLLLPLGVLAVLSLVSPGTRRGVPPLVVALLGFATAVLASRVELVSTGAGTVGVWPGSGLSVFWLGLVGATVIAIDALGRAASGSAILVTVASVLVAVPLLSSGLLGTLEVRQGTGRTLPAFVDAEATGSASVGTVIIDPLGDATIAASLQRGRGTTLDDQSTLGATSLGFSSADERLAVLAGNLVSRSGYDTAGELDDLAIGFVVLDTTMGVEATDDQRQFIARAREALDGNALFTPIGNTSNGLLWRYADVSTAEPDRGPSNTGSTWGLTVLIVQGAVLITALLLALPSMRRRRRVAALGVQTEDPASTFDEDDDD